MVPYRSARGATALRSRRRPGVSTIFPRAWERKDRSEESGYDDAACACGVDARGSSCGLGWNGGGAGPVIWIAADYRHGDNLHGVPGRDSCSESWICRCDLRRRPSRHRMNREKTFPRSRRGHRHRSTTDRDRRQMHQVRCTAASLQFTASVVTWDA